MTTFTQLPNHGPLYWQALRSRKPALVPAGVTVPRLDATWAEVRVDAENLEQYRALCGFAGGETLPLPYPHVMASALHLALLSSPGFPVRLLGLVHLSNRIEAFTDLPKAGGGQLHVWLEGHDDGERMQTFDLHTEWRDGATLRWRELTRFIVKKRAPKRDAQAPLIERPRPVSTTPFVVPAGLGRRYSRVGGDINPIHLFDLTAKLFGFERAIIHGMWTLARCVAELKPEGPCVVDVQFKRPVFIPSMVTLERVPVTGGEDFAVVSEKVHLTGTLRAR
ncbi:MAG: hypothetical protein JNM69_22445 [Archangium sp.]|nr:hypothetical protein [Archangium sp.]